MTRVSDSRDAQRIQEQKQTEKRQGEKSKRESQEFSKMMSQRQENTSKANTRQQLAQGKHVGQKAGAQARLAARQGISANSFAQQLQEKGTSSLGQKQVQTKSRDDEMRDTRRAGDAGSSRAEKGRVEKQGDKLAAIQRHDREGGGGRGGEGSDMGGGAGDLGGQEGQLGSSLGGMHADAAQNAKAQEVQGAQGPRLPQQVLQELVKRVMIGVNEEGLTEMHIEFNQDVLAGTRLQISVKDGKISARFHTDDVNIRRLLKASEGELARVFGRKGMTLERLEVEGP